MKQKKKKIYSIFLLVILIAVSLYLFLNLVDKEKRQEEEETQSTTQEPYADPVAEEEETEEKDTYEGIDLPPIDVTDAFKPVDQNEENGTDNVEKEDDDHGPSNTYIPPASGDQGDLPIGDSFH